MSPHANETKRTKGTEMQNSEERTQCIQIYIQTRKRKSEKSTRLLLKKWRYVCTRNRRIARETKIEGRSKLITWLVKEITQQKIWKAPKQIRSISKKNKRTQPISRKKKLHLSQRRRHIDARHDRTTQAKTSKMKTIWLIMNLWWIY